MGYLADFALEVQYPRAAFQDEHDYGHDQYARPGPFQKAAVKLECLHSRQVWGGTGCVAGTL